MEKVRVCMRVWSWVIHSDVIAKSQHKLHAMLYLTRIGKIVSFLIVYPVGKGKVTFKLNNFKLFQQKIGRNKAISLLFVRKNIVLDLWIKLGFIRECVITSLVGSFSYSQEILNFPHLLYSRHTEVDFSIAVELFEQLSA